MFVSQTTNHPNPVRSKRLSHFYGRFWKILEQANHLEPMYSKGNLLQATGFQ